MEWTRQKCIICGLVVIAILLTMYLFRHYTVIEGFELSTSSLSSSLSSSVPSLSSSTSEYGSIGPLPADNKWSDATVADFKLATKAATGQDWPPNQSIDDYFKYATEDDAKYYIKNKKWDWPPYYINCIREYFKKSMEEDATRKGTPAPKPEEIQKLVDQVLSGWQNRIPIRIAIMLLGPIFFKECIGPLKETKFINEIVQTGYTGAELGENKQVMCGWDSKTTGNTTTSVKALKLMTMDPTTKRSSSEEAIGFDKLPSLVKGFTFLKDGKTTTGEAATCDNFRLVPFKLGDGVSPFYQALWGTPSSSMSSSLSSSTESTPASINSSSSQDAAKVLKQIKTQLDSMPL